MNKRDFGNDLIEVYKIKECLVLNRPAYVGMCILDLSKTLMYDFHYNYIKKKYGSRAKLGFTDRDSLRYEITTKNAYKDFRADKDKFGNSDYPKDSPFHDPAKKVIGKFKDEAAGMPIREFIGLKSKMYSYVKDNGKNEKTCRGVKKDVIEKSITHENYRDTLRNGKQLMRTINTSCFDEKRYILEDGISNYAYGHKNI